MRRWMVGAVLVVSIALLAACGGGDEASEGEPGAGVEAGTTTEAPAAVLTMTDWDAVVASPHGREGDGARGIIGRAFVVERGAAGAVLVARSALRAACGGGDEASEGEPGAGAEAGATTEAPAAVLTMTDWDAVVAWPHGREGDRARGIIGRAFVVDRGAEGTA